MSFYWLLLNFLGAVSNPALLFPAWLKNWSFGWPVLVREKQQHSWITMCLDNRKHSLCGFHITYLEFFPSLILRFHLEGSGISSLWCGPSHPRCHLPVPRAASLRLAGGHLPPHRPPGFVQTGLGGEPAEGKIREYGHKGISLSQGLGRARGSGISSLIPKWKVTKWRLYMYKGFGVKTSIQQGWIIMDSWENSHLTHEINHILKLRQKFCLQSCWIPPLHNLWCFLQRLCHQTMAEGEGSGYLSEAPCVGMSSILLYTRRARFGNRLAIFLFFFPQKVLVICILRQND